MSRRLTLPTDSETRKGFPLFRGCLRYFSAALAGVARISKLGNDKHNPGQAIHHARGKSNDHADCVVRHLMDIADMMATRERPGVQDFTNAQILDEVDQFAWRALAFSQELHEVLGAPVAPGARHPDLNDAVVPAGTKPAHIGTGIPPPTKATQSG